MRSAREGQGQSGGRVGMQICWLYLHAFTGVCETQCVCVCEWAVCACTCCLSKNYAPRSPMPQSIRASCSSRRRRQPNIAKLLPARPLPFPFPRRRPLSQFVCLRLVVCNAFATVLTASADCTANLPHYPHACNNLQLSSVCRRYPPPPLPHAYT